MKLAFPRQWIVLSTRIKVSIVGLAELSPSTKTQIKWQLIWLAQLASILDGRESMLGVVISHKAIVVPMVSKVQGAVLNLAKYTEALFKFFLGHRSSDSTNVNNPAFLDGFLLASLHLFCIHLCTVTIAGHT